MGTRRIPKMGRGGWCSPWPGPSLAVPRWGGAGAGPRLIRPGFFPPSESLCLPGSSILSLPSRLIQSCFVFFFFLSTPPLSYYLFALTNSCRLTCPSSLLSFPPFSSSLDGSLPPLPAPLQGLICCVSLERGSGVLASGVLGFWKWRELWRGEREEGRAGWSLGWEES